MDRFSGFAGMDKTTVLHVTLGIIFEVFFLFHLCYAALFKKVYSGTGKFETGYEILIAADVFGLVSGSLLFVWNFLPSRRKIVAFVDMAVTSLVLLLFLAAYATLAHASTGSKAKAQNLFAGLGQISLVMVLRLLLASIQGAFRADDDRTIKKFFQVGAAGAFFFFSLCWLISYGTFMNDNCTDTSSKTCIGSRVVVAGSVFAFLTGLLYVGWCAGRMLDKIPSNLSRILGIVLTACLAFDILLYVAGMGTIAVDYKKASHTQFNGWNCWIISVFASMIGYVVIVAVTGVCGTDDDGGEYETNKDTGGGYSEAA